MRVFLHWFGLLIGAYVLQSSFLPLLSHHGITANLMLLSTVSFAFLRGRRLGVLMGFLSGMLLDLVSGTFFGMNIFSQMVIGYLCGAFSNHVFKEQFFLPIMASMAATVMNYFILAVIMVLLGYRFNLIVHMQQILLPMICYNLLFSYPIHRVVYALYERTKEKK